MNARLEKSDVIPSSYTVDGGASWHLPSGSPFQIPNLCGLAQPSLQRPQNTPNFLFQDAALLLVVSGNLTLQNEAMTTVANSGGSLLLVQPDTSANLIKKPGGHEQRFRSVFMTFAPQLLEFFDRNRPNVTNSREPSSMYQIALDTDLESTLLLVCNSICTSNLSEERVRYRLLDLLAGLAEHGHYYRRNHSPNTAGRLRALLAAAPDFQWTAHIAGRELAMSEATLRRRLAQENARFEDLLVDVRMHHGLMLVQTTDWSIIRIAEASGYRSRARFAERFKQRFGYLPSSVR